MLVCVGGLFPLGNSALHPLKSEVIKVQGEKSQDGNRGGKGHEVNYSALLIE